MSGGGGRGVWTREVFFRKEVKESCCIWVSRNGACFATWGFTVSDIWGRSAMSFFAIAFDCFEAKWGRVAGEGDVGWP